jgi:hypothetical protein
MKNSFSSADELDGFNELQPADQEKIRKAWEDGNVADEDIPETARKAEGGDDAEEAKPKKKRAPANKDGEGEAAKPKKARTSKKASRYRPWVSLMGADLVAIYRSRMKMVMRRMIAWKRKSPRMRLRQSLAPRQTFLLFCVCIKECSYQCFQKAKDEDEGMNGVEEGGEEKAKKKAAPSKKAPAPEKKAEKKVPVKKRAPKKVRTFSSME